MVYLIWWGGIASRSVELLLLLNHHLIIGGHVLLVRITRVLILREEDVNKNSLALRMKFKTLFMSDEEKHGHVQNRTKYCNNRNNIFLPKFTQFYKICTECFGQFFCKRFSWRAEKMPSRTRFYFFRKMVKNAKWWSKSNLPFLTAIFYPFLHGFK